MKKGDSPEKSPGRHDSICSPTQGRSVGNRRGSEGRTLVLPTANGTLSLSTAQTFGTIVVILSRKNDSSRSEILRRPLV